MAGAVQVLRHPSGEQGMVYDCRDIDAILLLEWRHTGIGLVRDGRVFRTANENEWACDLRQHRFDENRRATRCQRKDRNTVFGVVPPRCLMRCVCGAALSDNTTQSQRAAIPVRRYWSAPRSLGKSRVEWILSMTYKAAACSAW